MLLFKFTLTEDPDVGVVGKAVVLAQTREDAEMLVGIKLRKLSLQPEDYKLEMEPSPEEYQTHGHGLVAYFELDGFN